MNRLPAVMPRPYIALAEDDTFDFRWLGDEVEAVIMGWNEGLSVWTIAERVRRDPDELMVLLIDLSRRGKIKPRPGWIWGRSKQ